MKGAHLTRLSIFQSSRTDVVLVLSDFNIVHPREVNKLQVHCRLKLVVTQINFILKKFFHAKTLFTYD